MGEGLGVGLLPLSFRRGGWGGEALLGGEVTNTGMA